MEFPPAFFVTGTDTDVGKTIVSALLTIALDGTYWKPIQSGRDDRGQTDSDRLRGWGARVVPERFCLSQPLSPHLAARLDGVRIELGDFELPVVEGRLSCMVLWLRLKCEYELPGAKDAKVTRNEIQKRKYKN